MYNVMYCYEVVHKGLYDKALSRELYKTLDECIKVIENKSDEPQRVDGRMSGVRYESDSYIYIIYEMNVKG